MIRNLKTCISHWLSFMSKLIHFSYSFYILKIGQELVRLPRYCIQRQIEGNLPPVCIFAVCEKDNKISSKNFQKLGNFHVVSERTEKTVISKFSGWGFYFPGIAFNGKLIGTFPHLYLLVGSLPGT